ncbi:Protein NSP-INTERACTING KINASE [Trichinella spiralis]|uniref:Protein NSP-INTERACTING KINASE n=1 Tax=Trichinella spiralis TaxID=6334 RepID=A0ABR3KPZ6_TRISP
MDMKVGSSVGIQFEIETEQDSLITEQNLRKMMKACQFRIHYVQMGNFMHNSSLLHLKKSHPPFHPWSI